MNTALQTQSNQLTESSRNGELSIGVESEKNRAIAEIQSALTVAQARPRDEARCITKIETACERKGLAAVAEYDYSKGGTHISGATIKLMTVIANYWGNIQFGFRELSRVDGKSLVQAYAWDLETNSRRMVEFTATHERESGGIVTRLTSPRDIYESISNQAQRRVRSCLEAVIPPDVVEDALIKCRETDASANPVTPETIEKLTAAFKSDHNVDVKSIETFIQRKIGSMTQSQMTKLRRIWKSLDDGVSKPSQWFPDIAATESGSSLAAKLAEKVAAEKAAKKKTKAKPEDAEEVATTPEQSAPQESADLLSKFSAGLANCKNINATQALLKTWSSKTTDEELFMSMTDAAEVREKELTQ